MGKKSTVYSLQSTVKKFTPKLGILGGSTIYYLLSSRPAYAASDALGPSPAGAKELEALFGRIISVAVGLGFIALVVMLVLAGIKFLTSGGEAKAVKSASDTVTWALLGLLFMALAWLILLLIQNFTGLKVTIFQLSPTLLPGYRT